MLRIIIHYGLHFAMPLLFARLYDKEKWMRIYAIFLASMLVDVDHLFATPIFDPNRLSVGHHFLHSYFAMGVYALGLFFRPTRILAFALIFHLFTDIIDYMMKLIFS